MKNLMGWLLSFLCFFMATSLYAASLGTLADNLMGPMSGLGHIMNGIFYVAGVGFLLGGLLQYKYHRENPQQVRISTPLILIFLGLVILAVPIVAMLSESGSFL